MSRMLPKGRQSLDYTLWEEVRVHAQDVDRIQAKYVADRDRGDSQKSDYWQKRGRERSEVDETKVIDFIGIDPRFQNWFDEVELRGDGLKEDIELELSRIAGSEDYFKGHIDEFLEINWGVLGRVVGAAVANIGSKPKTKSKRWWYTKGSDSRMSSNYWFDFKKKIENGFVRQEDWDEMVIWNRERGFDPSNEMRRAESHRPSSPFWERNTNTGLRYHGNPLALKMLEQSRQMFLKMGDRDDIDEFANFHGTITMELLKRALVKLNQGKSAAFIIEINGICALHCMQDTVTQQKIGLHLLTNLALRKQLRGVDLVNVPDLASNLDTGFIFGKVLFILHKHKFITWKSVEQTVVADTISRIRSL
tara:strand:- start:1543 stop:2631 length:1089 start_codon:yes stop_codon:yes gene_type:complete